MSEQEIFDLLRAALWTGVWVGAPMMAAALIVGVIVGLFQALTSIQEMTLTFAPKLIVMLLVFWLCGAFMAQSLVALFENRLLPAIDPGAG